MDKIGLTPIINTCTFYPFLLKAEMGKLVDRYMVMK